MGSARERQPRFNVMWRLSTRLYPPDFLEAGWRVGLPVSSGSSTYKVRLREDTLAFRLVEGEFVVL